MELDELATQRQPESRPFRLLVGFADLTKLFDTAS
jgi:hypothetical protein